MFKSQLLCIFAAVVLVCRVVAASSIEEVHGFEPRFVMPPDAGMVSIRDFGAVGDGKTDDTAAFRKAIGTDQPRAIYIPSGTYRLNDQLRFGVDGKQKKKVTLIGESRSKTILKLAPTSDGFGEVGKPKAFIHARHPKQQGEQNMHNYLMHLTIEIGEGNPGAIALEYHSNNTGAVKDVAIRATDPVNGRGFVGLSCNEWEVGPVSVRYVSIEGFRTGVHLGRIANYVTVEHLTVSECDIATVHFRNGCTLTLRDIHSAHMAEPNDMQCWFGQMSVFGTRAGATLHPLAICRTEPHDAQSIEIPSVNNDLHASHHPAYVQLFDWIRGGPAPEGTPGRALLLMRLIDALYVSARSGGQQVRFDAQ